MSNTSVIPEKVTKISTFKKDDFGNLKERILSKLEQLEEYYCNLTKEQRKLESRISGLKTEKGSYHLKTIRGYGPYLYFVSSDGKSWMYLGRAIKYYNGILEKQKEARKLYNRLKQVIREKRQIIKAMQKATEILQGW